MNLPEVFEEAEARALRKALRPIIRYIQTCVSCGRTGPNAARDGSLQVARALVSDVDTMPLVSRCVCGEPICGECYSSARCPCASRG